MEHSVSVKRLWQLLGMLLALASLSALFTQSSLRQSIGWQIQTLDYVRGGVLRQVAADYAAPNGPAGSLGDAPATIETDHASGYYNGPIKVTLTQSTPGLPIYYRLDTAGSAGRPLRYHKPIAIDKTAVVSFASSASDLATRRVDSRTYLVNETDALPQLSLAVNPAFLWNRYTGIYRNPHERGPEWQRPARVELFERKNFPPTSFPAEIKIHGNASRAEAKKSFQLAYSEARVSGGDRRQMVVWPGGQAQARSLVLRAAGVNAAFRLGDELFRSIYGAAGGLITRGERVELLINGAPWGLYNLYEKIDEALLESLYGAGEYVLTPKLTYGKMPEDWNTMLDFFISHDLAVETNYRRAAQLIDIENFTDYWLFNIYAANLDWPHNNHYAYRKRAAGERWRWISWDADATFDGDRGLAHDTLAWATRDELRHDLSYAAKEYDDDRWLASTAIIRSLLRNPDYEARFVRRFCELHQSVFKPDLLQARFQAMVNQITPHMEADWHRWPGSKRNYPAGVESVRLFIAERPAIVLAQFQKRFRFSGCPAS